jgi:hypothetical protein
MIDKKGKMEEIEGIKIPCTLPKERLVTIKNYLIKELDIDEYDAPIIALRTKLRSGTVIRYDLSRYQSKWELGPTTILDFMKKYFITEDDVPELKTNFPTMCKMCREKDLRGHKYEMESINATSEI